VAAACVMVGFLYRIAAPLFFLAFTYFFLLDQTRYMNHFYLVCLISFLMCFLPAERAFSVDALLRRSIRSDVVPAWTLWLLRAQVGIPFFYGGIAKLNSDWVHGWFMVSYSVGYCSTYWSFLSYCGDAQDSLRSQRQFYSISSTPRSSTLASFRG
jgi:surface polysaccharide O-acyltransferase-like enzyme